MSTVQKVIHGAASQSPGAGQTVDIAPPSSVSADGIVNASSRQSDVFDGKTGTRKWRKGNVGGSERRDVDEEALIIVPGQHVINPGNGQRRQYGQ